MNIVERISNALNINASQIEASIKLIDEGCTIPFIARYRKEVTGNLNDNQLRDLYDKLIYLRSLNERMTTVINSIEEQGKMTDELRKQIGKTKFLPVCNNRSDCFSVSFFNLTDQTVNTDIRCSFFCGNGFFLLQLI